MEYEQLIIQIEKYGKVNEEEKEKIRKSFFHLKVKKKQIMIERGTLCNKLFFINKGLLRTYYIDKYGNEFTRRIAWENGFLTNMESFRKNGIDNNETIECIEEANVLQIDKKTLDTLLLEYPNLSKIYQIILEKYMAINIRRYQHISISTPLERLVYFNKNYRNIKNRINDNILASFLSISRKTLLRTKKKLIQP